MRLVAVLGHFLRALIDQNGLVAHPLGNTVLDTLPSGPMLGEDGERILDEDGTRMRKSGTVRKEVDIPLKNRCGSTNLGVYC
jgi:hypothetical protein